MPNTGIYERSHIGSSKVINCLDTHTHAYMYTQNGDIFPEFFEESVHVVSDMDRNAVFHLN